MKKRVFLKILVAIVVLTSILLSSFLGVTKSEYFKTFSKKLDIEAKPDLKLEYFLVDSEKSTSATQAVSQGVYDSSESFQQKICAGIKDAVTIASGTHYLSSSIVYQVKIPVDESGYYTLDFNVDFLLGAHQEPGNKDMYTNTKNPASDIYNIDVDIFSVTYRHTIGCEVLTSTDDINFGENKPFRMKYRTSKYDEETTYGGNNDTKAEPVFYSDSSEDSVYQWKTLTPSRAENVKLAFKATDADVKRGYVIWAWDLEGLEGKHNYRLNINNLSLNKTMELDGTTKYRTNDDPYFMFPQTSFVNTQRYHYYSNASGDRSSNVPGKTHSSGGRGTYVTEATANSLGMRAEMVYSCVNTSNGTVWKEDNPIGLYIPLKNVKYDTTYKVTFDFFCCKAGKYRG